MRATTLVKDLLDLPGIVVTGVSLDSGVLTARIALRGRKLRRPLCEHATWSIYDRRPVESRWRHLDFGTNKVVLSASLRRLRCPRHGVVTEYAPFARYRSGFTAGFEEVAAFLATRTDKSAIARFLRIDWDTVGRIIERAVATELDTGRLEDLVTVGVDDISRRKHHKYLTLVSDHATGKIVWGTAGICIDPFHAVKLVTHAFDTVRREIWQRMRQIDPHAAKLFKGARWALLKNPETLDDDQNTTLRRLRRRGGQLWAAYTLKEAFRQIFAGDLDPGQALTLIERWCRKAEENGTAAFAKAAKTIRKQLTGITEAIERRINNGRHEGINSNVRLIIRRARGFHTAEAALALVMLTCGPITLQLPHEQRPD